MQLWRARQGRCQGAPPLPALIRQCVSEQWPWSVATRPAGIWRGKIATAQLVDAGGKAIRPVTTAQCGVTPIENHPPRGGIHVRHHLSSTNASHDGMVHGRLRADQAWIAWGCETTGANQKQAASRRRNMLKTVPNASSAVRSGCARQGLMICCRYTENE